MTNIQELIEELANLEHEQWAHWSRAVHGDVSTATREKWKLLWVDYEELDEEMKEIDRAWARKVIELLRGKGIL